jgi:hypothetical protein
LRHASTDGNSSSCQLCIRWFPWRHIFAQGFQFRTHPNIDKATYNEESVLALKDPSRPFPTGSELGILKWRLLVGVDPFSVGVMELQRL